MGTPTAKALDQKKSFAPSKEVSAYVFGKQTKMFECLRDQVFDNILTDCVTLDQVSQWTRENISRLAGRSKMRC